jgi:hypothetical protein|tara:strand:+ start:284 stop:424 length:141 start_codon:yes stop_codon:yes gene_type:complete
MTSVNYENLLFILPTFLKFYSNGILAKFTLTVSIIEKYDIKSKLVK